MKERERMSDGRKAWAVLPEERIDLRGPEVNELAVMLGWALDWIESVCEVPLADDEPGPREKWDRATNLLAEWRATTNQFQDAISVPSTKGSSNA